MGLKYKSVLVHLDACDHLAALSFRRVEIVPVIVNIYSLSAQWRN